MTLQVTQTGVRSATGAASAGGTLPLNASGAVPRFVRIATTAAAHVRIGKGAQTSVNTDLMISPGEPTILATLGADNYAAIQAVAAGVIQISSVEDM